MTYLVIVVLIAIIVGSALYVSGRGLMRDISDVRQVAGRTRQVNLAAFRRLCDLSEMQYLRRHMSTTDFRHLQRMRTRVELEYLTAIFQNAAILLRVGELTRSSQRQELSDAGQRLVASAVSVRWLAAMAIGRCAVGYVWPTMPRRSDSITHHYEQLRDQLASIVLIQFPSETSRVCAAI